MNLNTHIDFDPGKFWRWWLGELAYFVPQNIKRLFRHDAGQLICLADANGISLVYRAGDGSETSATLNDFARLKASIPRLDEAMPILRLASGLALKKRLYLPVATLENLQQVVGFEIDRHTPFQASQLYFSAVAVGKPDQGQIEVLLVAAPRTVIETHLGELQTAGIQPQHIDYQAVTEQELQGQHYDLLPERYRPRSSNLRRTFSGLLFMITGLLLLATLLLPIWHLADDVDYLQTQLQSLQKRTAVIDEQQSQIEAMLKQTRLLTRIKAQSPSLLKVLDELSKLLDDATWLTNFQYSERRLQIQGQSPSASNLIGVLEESPYFENVRFVSPLTQDKTTGKERFQISLEAVMPEGTDHPATDPGTEPDSTQPTARQSHD